MKKNNNKWSVIYKYDLQIRTNFSASADKNWDYKKVL